MLEMGTDVQATDSKADSARLVNEVNLKREAGMIQVFP